MAMKAGSTDTIEYMAPGANGRRTAYLTDTDVHTPGTPISTTDDPDWVVYNPHDNSTNKVEWMEYVNPAGDFRAQLHAEYTGGGPADQMGHIDIEFEHERLNGADNHNDARMDVRDWDGNWWRLTIERVGRPFPRRPVFRVEPLQL